MPSNLSCTAFFYPVESGNIQKQKSNRNPLSQVEIERYKIMSEEPPYFLWNNHTSITVRIFQCILQRFRTAVIGKCDVFLTDS